MTLKKKGKNIMAVIKMEVNEFNKPTHIIYDNGQEQWIDYDDKGREIHFKNSEGYEDFTSYDDENGMINGFRNNRGFATSSK